MSPQIRVSELNIYPVKSCAAIPLQSVELDARGLARDRRWMIVGEGDAIFLSQRSYPRMALIRPTLEAGALRLSAPGVEDLVVPFAPEREKLVTARVWLDLCDALDDGDEAAAWLSSFLRLKCRLVHMRDGYERIVDPKFSSAPATVGFADAFPLLILSRSAVEALNAKLESPAPIDRFRPNIVVDGCEPHAEDGWRRIRVGGIEMEIAKPCVRCTIVTIDQATGEKRGPEPLQTLATYRKEAIGVTFGQNAIARGTGTLRVGDEVEVLA